MPKQAKQASAPYPMPASLPLPTDRSTAIRRIAAVFLDGKVGCRCGQVNALGGLVYLQDDKSKQKFLVDTGAAVSVLPHKELSASSGPPLASADGKTIPSCLTRSLSFAMSTFLCTFILAAVSKPILGTNLLSQH